MTSQVLALVKANDATDTAESDLSIAVALLTILQNPMISHASEEVWCHASRPAMGQGKGRMGGTSEAAAVARPPGHVRNNRERSCLLGVADDVGSGRDLAHIGGVGSGNEVWSTSKEKSGLCKAVRMFYEILDVLPVPYLPFIAVASMSIASHPKLRRRTPSLLARLLLSFQPLDEI